jgi:hypothetical protein
VADLLDRPLSVEGMTATPLRVYIYEVAPLPPDHPIVKLVGVEDV